MVRTVVLGRFQPFHCGHEGVVKAALAHAAPDDVMIAIGSSEAEASMRPGQGVVQVRVFLLHVEKGDLRSYSVCVVVVEEEEEGGGTR